ncbi:DUF3311 domain-containing protein [Rhodococcus opacus]|uniref:DUF3311 domain-containing protein n=1 Tax=Rhodococcus opacus TaxID=37919 RepID=UPI001F59E349|nr:DUF3311 domain-containing protein [Rhodococcus opacus]UNN04823.1 DUF3311 domain-containing protein [Rhodococcus opacus]
MIPAPPPSTPPDNPRPTLSWTKRVICTVLVATPVALALSVPLYQHTEPTLGGLPFFYWFQMTMAIAAACGCGATYYIAFRNEPEIGDAQ